MGLPLSPICFFFTMYIGVDLPCKYIGVDLWHTCQYFDRLNKKKLFLVFLIGFSTNGWGACLLNMVN